MLYKRSSALKARKHNAMHKQTNMQCPFCDLKQIKRVVEQTNEMLVIENHIPYDVFEGGPVTEHYMIIPRRHHKTFSSLSDTERLDYMEVLARYEDAGFNAYTRTTSSKTRSVEHLHTHLIKTPHARPKLWLYIQKPYFMGYWPITKR